VFDATLPLPFEIFRVASEVIGLVVKASAKPGLQSGQRDMWTLYAHPTFARRYALPRTKKEGFQAMQDEFFRVFRLSSFRKNLITTWGTPFGLLWPHGQPCMRLTNQKRAIFSPEARVGVCADYCGGGPSVQAAVTSAILLAEALTAHRDGRELPHDVLTDLTAAWEPVPCPAWIIADFPALPVPPALPRPMFETPISCCPTHDWLGKHPGLVFGRTAALKPWQRDQVRARDGDTPTDQGRKGYSGDAASGGRNRRRRTQQ